jgi:sortase A
MRGAIKTGAVALGALLVCVGAAYYGWLGYLGWSEQRAPSNAQIVALPDGRQVVLAQPTAELPKPPQPTAAPAQAAAQAPAARGPTPPAQPVLPPERLQIAKIGLDWPVVLSHNDHMPEFKGVGWMLGSAAPGATGNMVLFGHAGGPYGVFERLSELELGDELTVSTYQGALLYRVEAITETTPDDVTALLPSDTATATLITCSGPWDFERQTNTRRLVITARLLPAGAP